MHGITISNYYTSKEIDEILKHHGYHLITVKKILYNLGYTKEELEGKDLKTAYTKKYAWRTSEERDILNSKILEWFRDYTGSSSEYCPKAKSDFEDNLIGQWTWTWNTQIDPTDEPASRKLWMMERNRVFRRLILTKLNRCI